MEHLYILVDEENYGIDISCFQLHVDRLSISAMFGRWFAPGHFLATTGLLEAQEL